MTVFNFEEEWINRWIDGDEDGLRKNNQQRPPPNITPQIYSHDNPIYFQKLWTVIMACPAAAPLPSD